MPGSSARPIASIAKDICQGETTYKGQRRRPASAVNRLKADSSPPPSRTEEFFSWAPCVYNLMNASDPIRGARSTHLFARYGVAKLLAAISPVSRRGIHRSLQRI